MEDIVVFNASSQVIKARCHHSAHCAERYLQYGPLHLAWQIHKLDIVVKHINRKVVGIVVHNLHLADL
jgi:hypothetical protein